MLSILAIEPYYDGSHAAFLDGYRRHSEHHLSLLTMPARKWKWRMRGSALTLRDRVEEHGQNADALFVSDFLDLAALCGIRPSLRPGLPRVAYFHENQLTYPLRPGEERDYQFGFTNITTCLAADRVLFNSHYHRRDFLRGARELLGKMPDEVPARAPDRIEQRSQVVPVGVDLDGIDSARPDAQPGDGPLRILWNHRWEYDKGAEPFFEAMFALAEEGLPFELAATGQQFPRRPEVFEEAERKLADHLRCFGYVESRADYCRLMVESDVVVSTALQEFFGISVVEAVYAGCMPLVPRGLSYPEVIPESCHDRCLYGDLADLKSRLRRLIERPAAARAFDLSAEMEEFRWQRVAPRLDTVFRELCGVEDD